MKIITDLFTGEINIETDCITELIIENPNIMYRFINQLYNSINGEEEDLVLSNDNNILKTSKNIELVTTFIPFDINEKRLITKINALLEKEAVNELHYYETMNLLASIEKYINYLSEVLPCNIDYSSINISSLIKMCGVSIADDSLSVIERIYNYMNLVRDLLGEKIFVFVNMHSFFSNNDIQSFVDTVTSHKFYTLLIDSNEYDNIKKVRRIIIDKDLCII